jgi:predicted nucleotidyltransferase
MNQVFESSRSATLAALSAFAEIDPRIEAFWLQGSLATGRADPFSDIDAYLAIADESFAEVWAERASLLERLGGALAWSDATIPGLTAVHALMTNGARLDLFFEKGSSAPEAPRPVAKVLFDRSGLAGRLKLGWEAPVPIVGRIIQTIIRMTRQGATWPLRLLGRGQWPTLAMMELDLINRQLAQLMAVRHDPANYYKNPYSVQLLLTPQERDQLASLTTQALSALSARDAAALKLVHLRVLDALVVEGRLACAALGVDHPIADEADVQIRTLLERSWPA